MSGEMQQSDWPADGVDDLYRQARAAERSEDIVSTMRSAYAFISKPNTIDWRDGGVGVVTYVISQSEYMAMFHAMDEIASYIQDGATAAPQQIAA